ncbi:phosphatidate cytidylyltransferase [bacterium]|nr:phosphatidate cytidylyltransferase [bacterium]
MSADLRKRLQVAVLGVPFGILAAYVGDWFFSLMILVVSSLIIRELSRLLRKLDWHSIPWLSYVTNASLIAVAHFYTLRELSLVVIIAVVIGGLSSLRGDALRGARRLIPTFYVSFAVGYPVATLVMIRDSVTWESNFAGMAMIMMIIGGVWIVDTCAYFVGRSFGRHKLAPRLSPNKTIEGALGSLFGGALFAALWGLMIQHQVGIWHRIVIGLLIGSVSVLGDLVQSMLKRAAGVKDSGSMFPGHGGVYDRFDSLLFVAPTVFIYMLAAGLLVIP